MRILLAHNSLYFPSHGGGDKSNRLLMEALAERGHEVRVVTRVESFGDADHEKLLRELQISRGRGGHIRSFGRAFCPCMEWMFELLREIRRCAHSSRGRLRSSIPT